MNLRNKKKNFIYLISVLLLSFVVYIYIYFLIPIIEEKLEKRIIDISTSDIISTITKTVYVNFPESDFVDTILHDPDYREKIKEQLSLFISKRLKYLFIIYRDYDGRYKYLLDAESDEDVANLLFLPLKEEKDILEYVYAYKTRKMEVHKEINTIGITYYIPLVQSGTVRSTLVADFSFEALQEIKSLIALVQRGVLVSSIIILFILVIAIYYFYKNVILKQRAYIDSLTGIYNRNYLEDIRDIIDLKKYVVMMLDIDFFKNINDTYGHQVGDEILKSTAKLLKSSLRDEDIIIRYGGEEFLILIKRSENDIEGKWSLQVAQRLLQKIRDFKYKGINLTASIGLNLDTDKERNLMEAIKKADVALYRAKRSGRNRIEIYKETKSLTKEISLAELKDIIENQDIICYYQPIVNLKNKDVIYFESLARLKYKDQLLSPAQYLDLIKGTFLYFKFTKVVIEYNLNVLRENPDIKISINMSPSDFLNQTIVDILTSVEKSVVERINLEVLETEDVHNYNVLKENINRLKNYGYGIVLDDFGAGYVDFYYLTEIDAKYIKIDGSVIRKIPHSQQYYKLTKHLVQFCRDIDKIPVAEFIENEEIYNVLLDLGVELGQGYFISKPLSIEDAKNFPLKL